MWLQQLVKGLAFFLKGYGERSHVCSPYANGLRPLQMWEGDNTLTNHTWPEIARRWITCGANAELNKKRYPEAVAAATCLPGAPGGALCRPEGHLKLLLCLMEDCLDTQDIRSCVESRSEASMLFTHCTVHARCCAVCSNSFEQV